MPKRSKQINSDLAPAHRESFEPYWNTILIIVMGTFALFGIQSLTTAVQAKGTQEVTNCFTQSNAPAYHRFINCTNTNS